MNSQQHADLALARWQQMRDLAPDERIEALMAEFFEPRPPCDVEFEATMRLIEREMLDV